ncbi:HPF/RaiA family ribosome-associated protein [uncultured Rhodospira sp.]|uniref:HPF/RaiA family ribosome-associated protein n=1 Tax=uncultured Rhodospira sp. TaxID=1936189 RepID=UPI00261B6DB6|nr:HPF/RaiA family ribosome-associated protein [uncultured Rhodospira sp.]
MEQSLEVAFHGMSSSDALGAFIHEEAGKLDRFGKDVISARVSIERAQQHGASDVDEVHVDVHLRGQHLFTRATVEHRHRHESHGVYNAVTRAMNQMVRRLDKELGRRNDKPLLQASEGESTGSVRHLDRTQRHGFIERAEGPDLFFHEAVLEDATLDDITEGDAIHFAVAEAEGAYGPQARFVRPLAIGR